MFWEGHNHQSRSDDFKNKQTHISIAQKERKRVSLNGSPPGQTERLDKFFVQNQSLVRT